MTFSRFWTGALLLIAALLVFLMPLPALGQTSQLTIENLSGAPFHDRVVLSRIGSLAAPPAGYAFHEQGQIRLRNTGTANLQITGLSNTGQFQLVSPPTLPATITPGNNLTLTIRYIAQSGNLSGNNRGLNSGTLTITNTSPQPSVAVQLSGYWQSIPEGGFEPRLTEIVEQIFSYGTDILFSGQVLNRQGRIEAVGEEVISPYWRRANTGQPVSVQQLVAYHTPNAARLYWHAKGNTTNVTQVKRHAEVYMQSVLPHNFSEPAVTTVGTFAPSAQTFGFRVDGMEWSDPSLNNTSQDDCSAGPNTCGHHMRFWPAKDRAGIVIPNTYIMGMDYAGINYDYNDNVYLISNISPEITAPTNVVATGTTSGITLDWNNNPESDLAGYNVYRSNTAGGPYTKLNTSLLTSSDYVDTSVASGALAFYVIRAVDTGARESLNSAEKHATRLVPINTFTTIGWGNAAGQPLANTEAQSIVVGGKMYVFGGFDVLKKNGPCDCFTPTKRAYVYDPVANNWTAIADMPFPNDGGVTHAGIATDGTNIIIASGYISNVGNTGQIFGTKQVWRYNIGSNSWTRLPDLPVERSGGQLQYYRGKLHYFGGSNLARNQDVGTHYVLDYTAFVAGQNPTWTTAAAMPNGRHHMGSVVLNNLIYAVGGQHKHDGQAIPQATLNAYDPVTNTWATLAPLPFGRSHIAVVVHEGRIIVMGGERESGSANAMTTMSAGDPENHHLEALGNINNVTAYNPETNTWTELTPLPVQRKSGIGGSLNGNLFYSSGGLTTNTYKGTPNATSNPPPVARFTATQDGANPLLVHFDASTSTDDGTITNYAWDFGDITTGSGVTPDHTYPASGFYTVSLTVTDNGGLTGTTQKLIRVTTSTDPFFESSGQVVVEAENYHTTIARSSRSWTPISPSGVVGLAMETTPNSGASIDAGYATTSPELQYQITFATTGTYYVWARVLGPTLDDDSFHSGLDGQTIASADRIKTGTQGTWVWTNVTMDSNARATFSVPTTGTHVLNVWMREDGMQLDRLLLTTNAAFTPTGDGSTESPRAGSQPPLASFTATPDGTNPLLIHFDGSGSTDDGTITNYAWNFGDGTTGTGVTPNHTYATQGTYTVSLTVTDDTNLTGTIQQSVQVIANTAPFLEGSGQVVVEAENYHSNTPRSNHAWTSIAPTGVVGTAMVTTPNNNASIDAGYATTSPELQYQITFATTGTYYVWARVLGPTLDDDSFHSGLDGQTIASADRIKTGTQGTWVWTNVTMDSNARATFSVPTTGTHVLNVWMREDGMQLDRLLLTTSAAFTPTGNGPAESPRAGSQPNLACAPYSTLECLALPVSLPYTLTWSTDHSGLHSGGGIGTGFTLAQPPSARFEGTPTVPDVPGYEAGNLGINTSTGLLTVTTTKGTFIREPAAIPQTNSQLNALGVSFNAMQPAPFTITTALTNLPVLSGASASQQAGLWFGLGENNYVKLAAFYDGSGSYRVQLSYELNAGIITEQNTSAVLSGGSAVVLRLELDPSATTARGYYSLNGGTNFTPLGTAFALHTSLFAGTTLPDGLTGPVSFAGIFATHFQDSTPLAFAFDSFDLREIVLPSQNPSVTGTAPANGTTDIQRDAFIAADVLLPNVGQGIDASTLNSSTVKLYPTGNPGFPVPANLNTSGGGDAIVLQPTLLLAANTPYSFEVTSGLKDISGASFEPFTMSFTTGPDPTGPPNSNIRFEKVTLAGVGLGIGGRHPSLAIGPDGKLYATTITGVIKRWNINPDGTLSNLQQITSLQAAEGGNRLAIGLVFDPASTPSNLIAWVSHTTFGFSGMPDWGGKITRMSGPNLETVQTYVTNLPRSIRDHVTNSLSFGPDGALYVLQGSNSAMGAPDDAWGNRPEHRLNAAMLRIDVAALAASGNLPLDVKTEEGGTYDPYLPNAPVKIFASGLRNAYDFIWHSNGDIYVPTNGSAANGNSPASVAGTIRPDGTPYSGPMIPAIDSVETQNDYLFRIPPPAGGTWSYRYYGHPNPSRGEYVLNGGNPTAALDPAQINRYPVGTAPDEAWQNYAYNFGRNISPNGAIEYKSTVFGGELQGKLLVARYSGGDDIIVLTPDPVTKNIASDGDIVGLQGLTGFIDPLDLIENLANGHIYVSEYGGAGQIILLRPIANQPPVASFTVTTDGTNPLTIHFDASASTDDGTITTYAWDFGDTATGTGVTTSHTYAAGGSFTVTLTVTDNSALTDSTMQLVNVMQTGLYAETDGLVVFEAESYHNNIPRSAHTWNQVSPIGSVGTAMEATPNNGAAINTGYVTNSPELQYRVNFTTPGTYYVWGRVWAATNNDDSFHTGLDGQTLASADRLVTNQYNVWSWTNTTMDSGARATFSVASVGEHTVNVWMREDGLFIDRILLTTDPAFTPTDNGPLESPRISQNGNQTPVAGFTATPDGTDPLTIHFDASASTDDGTITTYAWDFGDTATGTGVTTSHTYTGSGSYTVTLVVTDDQSATGTAQQTFFVSDGSVHVVAETGTVTIDQSSPTQWHTVTLTHSFTNPVVVMGPFSYNGGHPSTVRVRNVTAGSFEFQLDEWDYLDGTHSSETVSYLVAETGIHTLEDGRLLQAGLTTVDAATKAVAFAQSFPTAPVVVSQVVTTNGPAAVVTRQQNISTSGFEMFLQEQQSGSPHIGELVAWVALRPGAGTTGGAAYEAGLTANNVTHAFSSLTFLSSYTQVPVFVAAMQTANGGDPATLRYRLLTTTNVQVKVEEEQSADAETNHGTERVGYFAFVPGLINGASSPLTKMTDESTASEIITAELSPPVKYTLQANYPNPFNPTTTIRYELPEQALVHLDVFDVTGRRVARLVDTSQPAGRYEAVFDASALPSGVYFYRIQAGTFSHTEKMILLK